MDSDYNKDDKYTIEREQALVRAIEFVEARMNEAAEALNALYAHDYDKARDAIRSAHGSLPGAYPLINLAEGLPDFPKDDILGTTDV